MRGCERRLQGHVWVAVIEAVELSQHRFNEADAVFAYDEVEGDGTLVLANDHRWHSG